MARETGKAVLVEINSETDFVAKDTNFIAFTEAVADAALGAADVEALKSASVGGKTVEELRAELIAKIGENVRSEEHTSELQSLMRISYAVFCLKKKKKKQ